MLVIIEASAAVEWKAVASSFGRGSLSPWTLGSEKALKERQEAGILTQE